MSEEQRSCKWCEDERCTNVESEMCGAFCPAPYDRGVCEDEDFED